MEDAQSLLVHLHDDFDFGRSQLCVNKDAKPVFIMNAPALTALDEFLSLVESVERKDERKCKQHTQLGVGETASHTGHTPYYGWGRKSQESYTGVRESP